MKIKVKNLKGKLLEFDVSETETVADLKERLSSTLNIEISSMKLVVLSKVMNDDKKKLVDYGIKENTTIILMVKVSILTKKNHLFIGV